MTIISNTINNVAEYIDLLERARNSDAQHYAVTKAQLSIRDHAAAPEGDKAALEVINAMWVDFVTVAARPEAAGTLTPGRHAKIRAVSPELATAVQSRVRK